MDLYEYQARGLFEKHALPVLPGIVATTPSEVRAAATDLATGTVVVKAQVKTGGRGKAGGVKLAHSPDEAETVGAAILGMDIKGHTVHKVMVVPGADIASEYYLSIILDRAQRVYLLMISAEGGMEIEQLAVQRPDALLRFPVDPAGITREQAAEIVQQGNFPLAQHEQLVAVIEGLWRVLATEDATLVEINPLIATSDDRIIALDGKVTLDDNAAFRHPDHDVFADNAATDPLEVAAHAQHLNYVKLDGSVGVIGNGAGLVMSTLDVVALAGENFGGVKPANFLDIGGGASAEVMAAGLGIILSDPDVRSVFVNVFGGITACDEVASGIIAALELLGDAATKPLVVRLDGNSVVEGRRILAAANHPLVTLATTMDDGAAQAAALAATK